MIRVIDAKIYDTEKAELLHEWTNGSYDRDFHLVEEALYRTAKGAFFVAGSGGPLTEYAVSAGSCRNGSSSIRVLDRHEAMEWLETHDGSKVLLSHFGDELEEA